MQTVTAPFVKGKRVLLRMDLDVPVKNGVIQQELRILAGLATLELCLQNASSVVICGHVGRPNGVEVESLSVAPVVNFLEDWYCDLELPAGRLHVLENLRFEKGEEEADLNFARQLAAYGDVFVNEAFAAHHPSASTTVIPTLLPSAAGLNFAREVQVLTGVKNNPKKPLIAIISGIKVEDKYPAIISLSNIADAVLVGGLLPQLIKEQNLPITPNILLGQRSENGLDLSDATLDAFANLIKNAKQVIWAGPVGKYEEPSGNKGNQILAQAVIASKADSIVGGGDTIAALKKYLDQFNFVSTGGGAMLRLLVDGTLPTIEALKS